MTTDQLSNLEELAAQMDQRHVEGLVVHMRPNVYYLSGYAPRTSTAIPENDGYAALFIARDALESPILVVPDHDLGYFLQRPGFVDDRRPYGSLMLPVGAPADDAGFDRTVPVAVHDTDWGKRARAHYADDLLTASQQAMKDLGLDRRRRIGFDDPRFATLILTDGFAQDVEIVDGYGLLRAVRQVKTEAELRLLRAASRINEAGIEHMVSQWQPGMTWRDLELEYQLHTTRLGGFAHDPGPVVMSNSPDDDRTFYGLAHAEEFVLEPGMNIAIDCHGTFEHYCWDGGKTWIVGGEPVDAEARRNGRAALDAMEAIQTAMRPGASISALTEVGVDALRAGGLPDADGSLIFFHGLGMDHIDREVRAAVRQDWTLREGSVVAAHVYCPGDRRHRFYLEDCALIRSDGATSLTEWTMDPLT